MEKVDFKDYIKSIAEQIGFQVVTFNVNPYEVIIKNPDTRHYFTFSSENFFYPCPSANRIYFFGEDQNINLDDLRAAIIERLEKIDQNRWIFHSRDEKEHCIEGYKMILSNLVTVELSQLDSQMTVEAKAPARSKKI
ncbi:MAG TPA: hypothetical protein VM577_10995 [Anaerovoracaceae bacterium]|nr:hypothetical protein [Anaerovoracaceae bacterium]